MVLGDPAEEALSACTGNVAPHDVAASPAGFWVVGTFSGHLQLFGKELRGGTAYGVPFLVRFDSLDSLKDVGAGLDACAASSEACSSCIETCTSSAPCAFVEDCSFAITELTRCLCRAPEEAAACAATWNVGGDPKIELVASCYADECQEVCGLAQASEP